MVRKIKLSDIDKIEIVTSKGMTDNKIYEKYKPDYLLNLALYDTTTGLNITHIKDDWKNSGYLFSNNGIGITKDNKIMWVDKDAAYKDDNIKDYCSFSPVLVENGKKSIQWGNKVSSYVNGNHYRSFCGFNEDYLFFGVSDNKNTIDELANYCVKQGMKFAGNNDGNGSMSLWENGKALKKSSRNNATWLLVWIKQKEQAVNDEVLDKRKINIDGHTKECEVVVKNGYTYIKLRDFESEGYKITYENGVAGISCPKK